VFVAGTVSEVDIGDFQYLMMSIIGGVLGVSLGVLIVVAFSAYRVWKTLLDPAAPLLAPLVGGAFS
jgi:prolipoprotein diacylglyceryltransferase